jgi:membrane protease YdiL (CAAX protease family)/tetratricopeptide (TPR) repeat protein
VARITTTKSLTLLLCLLAGRVLGQTPIDIENDFAPGTHKRFAERVNHGQTSIYTEVLAAYDARLAKYPDDVSTHIERCRFIESFAYAEDMVIESASADLESCQERLRQGPHAEHIDVILYGVEGVWEEDEVKQAQALIPESQGWTQEQQAVLFELLSDKFRWSDSELASRYAMQAVSLNPGSRVLIMAAERWIQLGAKDKARKLLINAPESTWENVSRSGAAKLLLDIGYSKAAGALLRAEPNAAAGGNILLARALAETGEIEAARESYRAAVKNEFVPYESRVEYFEFERKHGGRDEAVAAYAQLRDAGFGADILSRERLSLFVSHPGAPWQWREVWGFLLLIGLLLIFAASPVVVVAPVHYRGLARRVAGLAPDRPQPIWTLSHSWYALAVFWIGGVMTLYVFQAGFLEMMLPWSKRVEASATDLVLGRQLLWSTLITVLLVVPLLIGRPVKTLLLGRWSIRKSLLVGIGLALALRFVAGIIGLGLQSLGILGTDTVRAMQGAHQLYGVGGLLLIVAVAVPFVEELVFRGVLLEACRGQVTFMFATVLQAAVFALLHESWSHMPALFVFGLVAGWLAKRSEGLLAPIAMHAAFNLTAALTILGVTSALNR